MPWLYQTKLSKQLVVLSIIFQTHFAINIPEDSETHRIVIVEGWNDDDQTRHAVACYFVGLKARAIDAALNVRSEIEDMSKDRTETV